MIRLRLFFLLSFVLAPVSFGADTCGPQAGPLVKSLFEKFGTGAYNFAQFFQKWLITDPEARLQPGDILIYPFQQAAAPGGGARPEEPAPYRAALEGFGHAGIVARDESGALYHLDAPLPPVPLMKEFRGERAYYVVRPKRNPGMEREAFEKQLNTAAAVFRDFGFEYDALMDMDFMDPTRLEQIKKVVAEGCANPATRRSDFALSPLPAQFCSELTQTLLVLSGVPAAQPVKADRLLTLAVDHARRELGENPTPAQVQEAVKKAVDAIILMFAGPLDRIQQEMEGDLQNLTKQADALRAEGADVTELEGVVEELRGQISSLQREKARWEVGRLLLTNLANQKLSGAEGEGPAAAMLDRPIIRPVDILRQSMDPNSPYELVGFYPGHLPATCQFLPRFGGPEGEGLPPPEGVHEPVIE